jgi:nitrite reductase/ring-hydroxylating ferredoxin subunit
MSDQDTKVCEGRRRFIFSASAAAIAAGTVFPACGTPMNPGTDGGGGGPDADPGTDSGGAGMEVATGVMAASLMPGQVQLFRMGTNYLVLGRDGMGYYAMSGLCTHEECPVTVMAGASTIGCSCNHGSVFSLTGAVNMPATVRPNAGGQPPLQHFQLEIRAGAIVVFVGRNVPSTTRVAG